MKIGAKERRKEIDHRRPKQEEEEEGMYVHT
jgi:hypothetical protein